MNFQKQMEQKFLYLVDHDVPFPSSEYGGLWKVIAEDDNECFDLIAAEDDGNFYEHHTLLFVKMC